MTADGTSSNPEPILFEANIVPHRSLTAAGRRWVALGLIAMCGATETIELAMAAQGVDIASAFTDGTPMDADADAEAKKNFKKN